MTTITALPLDHDLLSEIHTVLDRLEQLKTIDPESNRYLNIEGEVELTCHDIGWSVVHIMEVALRHPASATFARPCASQELA